VCGDVDSLLRCHPLTSGFTQTLIAELGHMPVRRATHMTYHWSPKEPQMDDAADAGSADIGIARDA
jgi:hypothetical protein